MTPGGTIFSTTPGGTKIVYDRNMLMFLRQSPFSKTPVDVPIIPGVTAPKDSASAAPEATGEGSDDEVNFGIIIIIHSHQHA
jgi:hypothetical protein